MFISNTCTKDTVWQNDVALTLKKFRNMKVAVMSWFVPGPGSSGKTKELQVPTYIICLLSILHISGVNSFRIFLKNIIFWLKAKCPMVPGGARNISKCSHL